MGGYNTYDIRRIHSFEQAKKHYESVTPIRGDKDKTRPLGNRRYHRVASIEMPNPDTVNLMYGWGEYRKPLVQWRSDNTFTVRKPYFVNAYDPDNLTFYLPQGKFSWVLGRLFIEVPGGKRYLMTAEQEFNFQMIDGQMFMANKPVAYSYRIKRVPMARVMKEYEPFLDWLQVVLAVQHPLTRDELDLPYERFIEMAGVKSEKYFRDLLSITGSDSVKRTAIYNEQNKRDKLPFVARNSYGSNSNFHKPTAMMLHNWVTSPDAEDWVQAMYVIAKQAGEMRRTYGGTVSYAVHLRLDHARDYLRTMGIFLNRDEVLDKVRLDDGETPSKQNTKFFTEINFVL